MESTSGVIEINFSITKKDYRQATNDYFNKMYSFLGSSTFWVGRLTQQPSDT